MNEKFFGVVIGKKLIENFSNTLKIYSPTKKEIVGVVPMISTKEEINKIYQDSKKAFDKYKKTSFEKRKSMLLKFANLLEEKKDEISEIMNWEVAKTKKLSYDEIKRTVEYIKLTIDEYEKIASNPLYYDEKSHGIKGKIGTFIYEPIGVVLAISPFNYPLNLLIAKIAPALISGNSVVFKPATQGSCLGAYISTLLYDSGFKNGEISCVVGKGSSIGNFLIENENIGMISFTGSTKIGKEIAVKNPLIPVVLELGGNDAAIVLEDANIEETTSKIINGSFNYNGQRCTSIKRVLVHKNIETKFVKSINDKLKKLSIGSALEGDFDITEMIDTKAQNYNIELFNQAIKDGAKSDQNLKIDGNILHPIILYNVDPNSRIVTEEQFGPVLPIISFKTLDEAININNGSEYGLQASIFTSSIPVAKKIAQELEVVTVNINNTSSRSPDIFPFGGIKNSGKGLQGIREAIISMNKIKGIVENN